MKEGKREHPFVRLARSAIESVVRGEERPSQPDSPEMDQKAGVFVCIKKAGRLRGCIGTLTAATESIGTEIIENAVSAATKDPRFPSLAGDELDGMEIAVDVLTPPEPVENETHLDPKRYGIIVKRGFKRGVLLPDLEGVDSVRDQIEIAKRKAGILPGEDFELMRFEVKRYQ